MSAEDEFERLWRRVREVERSIREYVEEEFRRVLEDVRNELRSINRMLMPSWAYEGYLRPLYTVKDVGNAYIIYIDLPKVDEGSIDVRFKDNLVMIRAKLKEGLTLSNWSSRGSEVRFYEYREVIELPIRIDPEKVRVNVKRSRVQIIVPKD
ncbi:MAG: Hsp20/alpha crystallin family protein [Desulfurococcales archaeon]|nr:Hsp20/alpha crystallin family protein [Desulfurococcales archaeon]